MNTADQKYSRLLNLFPVDAMKARWPAYTGKKSDIIADVLQNETRADIDAFAAATLEMCKHRTFVFSAPQLNVLQGFALPESREIARSNNCITYLAATTYLVYSPVTAGATNVEFMWPVRIRADGTNIQVSIVTLEVSIQSYLPAGFQLLTAKKSVDEKEILAAILLGFVNAGAPLTAVDLHKGTKHLWNLGTIDSPKSRWKENNGTTTKAMDGTQLLRRDDLPTFQKLIAGPLFKTVFVTLDAAANFPAYFLVDPAAGEITFPRYTADAGFPQNVVRAILQNN